jgi:hypothetical protein
MAARGIRADAPRRPSPVASMDGGGGPTPLSVSDFRSFPSAPPVPPAVPSRVIAERSNGFDVAYAGVTAEAAVGGRPHAGGSGSVSPPFDDVAVERPAWVPSDTGMSFLAALGSMQAAYARCGAACPVARLCAPAVVSAAPRYSTCTSSCVACLAATDPPVAAARGLLLAPLAGLSVAVAGLRLRRRSALLVLLHRCALCVGAST